MKAASLVDRSLVLQAEFHSELIAIADWWAKHCVDHEQGGFYGEVGADNQPVKDATKGVILNARILWFFSEAAEFLNDATYKQLAQRAYAYLTEYFFDKDYGGVFWELDASGRVVNTKKQLYAQAFTIYALSAYFKLTRDELALKRALECFALIEAHGIDAYYQGYLEAFTRDWGVIEDLRLSEKDLNFPKSQNTHLHILEAYTALYQVHPNATIKSALRYNIELFDNYMIDHNTYHLRMFMDLEWKDFSPGFTYGHDIEASWLIAKALNALGDEAYTIRLTPSLIKIARTTLHEGVGPQGQVVDSFDFATQKINADNVWWVQAEALVGFFYAYSVTNDPEFFGAAEAVWEFIKSYQIDAQGGEWWWYSALDQARVPAIYKVGFWKCPYHNGRAMIEALRYLQL